MTVQKRVEDEESKGEEDTFQEHRCGFGLFSFPSPCFSLLAGSMSLHQLTKGSWLALCVSLKVPLPASILNGEEVIAKFSTVFPQPLSACALVPETTTITKV